MIALLPAVVSCLALLAAPAAARTVVTLTFDDTTAGHALAGQILAARGLRGTFYVNSPRFGLSGYMTLDQVRALAANGHEIGGHTLTHLDLATLSAADRQRQVCDDRAALVSAGFNPVSFAYPYGSYDSAVEATVAGCGYRSARTVGGIACPGCPKGETIPPPDLYAIGTPDSVKDVTTLDTMKRYVSDAEAAGGGWVVLVMHRICSGCGTYSISSTTLAAFADWVSARGPGTVVQTVAETLGAPAAPAPSVSSLNPSSAAAGGPAFTLTVNGGGFLSSSTVRWNGSDRATVFVSSSQLRAAILASDVASAGSFPVAVLNPGGGGLSNSASFTVAAPTAPPPAAAFFDGFGYPDGLITNANPSSPRSSLWLVDKGSLFASGGQGWTGVPDGATPNATSSNGTGSALFRALTNRSDFSTELSFTLTVLGFVSVSGSDAWDGPGAILRFADANNYYLVSVNRRNNRSAIKKRRGGTWSTLATAAYATPLNLPQAVRVTAVNDPSGSVTLALYVGGSLKVQATDASSPLTAPGRVGVAGEDVNFKFDDFAVGAPTAPAPSPLPVLASIAPSSAAAGGPAFTLSAFGSGFVSSSTVRWNGSGRPTVFVSSAQLTVAVSSADVAVATTAAVTVLNPGPEGGLSNAVSFAVVPGSSPSGAVFSDAFGYPDGLITNANPISPRSSLWLVTNGSLFASSGQGWTGVPDGATPNATSSNGTGSAFFRALTNRSDFSTELSFTLTVLGFVSVSGSDAWDGPGAILRFADANNYYQVSVNRRDNRAAIKKKRGGTWSTLATAAYATPLNLPQAVRITAVNNPSGSVTLALYVGGSLKVQATDASSPLTAPGRVGVSGEDVNFKFDDFTAQPSAGSGLAALGTSCSECQPVSPAPLRAGKPFPNPWRADRHVGLPLTLGSLAPNSEVRIYNSSGRWLRTIRASGGTAQWDLRTVTGAGVASGLYLYTAIDQNGQPRHGVLVILR